MNRLAETAMLSFGWRRALILIGAGALGGLSMPPLFFLPLLFVVMPIWVWCLDGAEQGEGRLWFFGPAFRIGFYFGLGYFSVAVHWIGVAFLVDGGLFLLLMPLAVLALAALLSLFWAFASAFAHLFWHTGPWRVLALALMLSIAEFARGHVFTGFPFDLLGYAFTATDAMSQLASIIGIYGLTALVALLSFLPALMWPADQRPLTRRLVPFFTIIVALVAQIAYGEYRLDTTTLSPRTDVKLRLIQPAIDQALKWQADSRSFTMERLLSLSETRLNADDLGLLAVTAVIWPESAMPFFLADQPEELARIARMLPTGKFLITGAPREDFNSDAAYNAVLVINADGEVVSSYDKTHLVPFGEYLPFQNLWEKIGIKQFVPGSEGWQKGDGRRVLSAGAASFLPLICYEVLFSGDLGTPLPEAQFMLNLTNDGWFDGSIGLAQHFHHARLRAVEEGMPLVRVANTGLTGLVDPLGRVSALIGAGEVGVVDVVPSEPLPPTPFVRFRHLPLLVLGIAAFGLIERARRRRRLI